MNVKKNLLGCPKDDKYCINFSNHDYKKNLNSSNQHYKKIFITNSISLDEIEFLKHHEIDIKELTSRWIWVLKYPNLATDFFKEVIYPKLGRELSVKKVKESISKGGLGYKTFIDQLRKIGMTYKDLVSQAGFEKNYLNFAKTIVGFIKKLIKVDHNNFKDYLTDLKKNGKDNLKILELMLSEEIFDKLFREAKMVDGKRNRLTASKCYVVINLALLKCQEYSCISKTLRNKSYIWKIVNNFIPLLKKIEPNADIDIWLPPEVLSLTYNNCISLAKKRDDVDFDMSKEEFNKAMKNRGKIYPSDVKLDWICTKNKHIFHPSYGQLKKTKSGCPHCYGNARISYNDCISLTKKRADIDFNMSKEEFKRAMENREGSIPSEVKLDWVCKLHNHPFLSTFKTLNAVNKDSSYKHICPFCSDIKRAIGTYFHPILEYISLKLLKLKNCSASYESIISKNTKFRYDLKVIRNKALIDLEEDQYVLEFDDYIKNLIIDFTFSVYYGVFLNKCTKYHSQDRFLIIVSFVKNNENAVLGLNNSIQRTKGISYKKNIKVLTVEEYLNFLGYYSSKFNSLEELKWFNKINKYVKLANDALESEDLIPKIVKKEKKYRKLLEKIN